MMMMMMIPALSPGIKAIRHRPPPDTTPLHQLYLPGDDIWWLPTDDKEKNIPATCNPTHTQDN
jgi:hypothetical protein